MDTVHKSLDEMLSILSGVDIHAFVRLIDDQMQFQ